MATRKRHPLERQPQPARRAKRRKAGAAKTSGGARLVAVRKSAKPANKRRSR